MPGSVDPYEFVQNNQIWNLASYNPSIEGAVSTVSLSYNISRVFTSNIWATQVTKGITVADIVPLFPQVDWLNGDAITFGFFDSVATSSTGFTIVGGYDNFQVTVNSVPLPATLFLFGSGLIMLLGRKRHFQS